MSEVQLKVSSIKNVPLQTYSNDFSFIVNGKEFKTSHLLSDLLSPKICQIHTSDPTFDQFTINTQYSGDFSHILQLNNFTTQKISDDELEFFIEVIEILGNESFNVISSDEITELTNNNVLKYIKKHEQHENFYYNRFCEEIEYLSSNFYELYEKNEEEIKSLKFSTISRILRSSNLHLIDEDQIVTFLNNLYEIDNEYSILYDVVIFNNVSSDCMKSFVDIIKFKDLSESTWKSLSLRLCSELKNESISSNADRYKQTAKIIQHQEGKELNGIIRYLTNKTGQNVHDSGTIEVTSNYTDSGNPPKNVVDFDNENCYKSVNFNTDACICFNFKDQEVEIWSYSIKSANNQGHAKSWVIEISSDGEKWEEIDSVSNSSELNGKNFIKTFEVQQRHFCKYCRFRHTGEYWETGYYFRIGCIEFYGRLKET